MALAQILAIGLFLRAESDAKCSELQKGQSLEKNRKMSWARVRRFLDLGEGIVLAQCHPHWNLYLEIDLIILESQQQQNNVKIKI